MDAVGSPPDAARLIPSGYRLRMPGPTAVPERVRQAMALPVISHRGPEFRRILGDVTQMLRAVIGTQDDIFLLAPPAPEGWKLRWRMFYRPETQFSSSCAGNSANGSSASRKAWALQWIRPQCLGEQLRTPPLSPTTSSNVSIELSSACTMKVRPASSPILPPLANYCPERIRCLSSTR